MPGRVIGPLKSSKVQSSFFMLDLISIATFTHPQQRPKSIGVFRLWRDLGYAFGALATGIIADILNVDWSVGLIGGVTLLSAWIIRVRMSD